MKTDPEFKKEGIGIICFPLGVSLKVQDGQITKVKRLTAKLQESPHIPFHGYDPIAISKLMLPPGIRTYCAVCSSSDIYKSDF